MKTKKTTTAAEGVLERIEKLLELETLLNTNTDPETGHRLRIAQRLEARRQADALVRVIGRRVRRMQTATLRVCCSARQETEAERRMADVCGDELFDRERESEGRLI